MMKKLQITLVAFLVTFVTVKAQTQKNQTQDAAPVNGGEPTTVIENKSNALFDLLFNYDVGANGSIGANGMAGVIFFNNQYWVSEWQTDQIHVLDNTGAFVESFSISGVAGARSFTTDGTSIYVGTAGLIIFKVDPSSRTLTGAINITTTSTATARMVTYDPTLDGGNGGFWIGDFDSDIASVDMSGNELSVIPSATHGTVLYGGAVDNVSPGGPYLWIHDQGVGGGQDLIVQLQLPSGTPTGVVYDYTTDAPAGNTGLLAGGLFISDDASPNKVALVGLCQCAPSNQLFGLELVNLNVKEKELANFTFYPNPADGGMVTIETGLPGEKKVSVFNILGEKVIDVKIENNMLNIQNLNSGVYMVHIAQNGQSATKKLVVR